MREWWFIKESGFAGVLHKASGMAFEKQDVINRMILTALWTKEIWKTNIG